MPKPIFGINGSGLHLHMSLWKDGQNTFYDENDSYQLSETARKFLGGILRYIKNITLVLNQWVNSYKRLVVGYEAPVYISWGRANRSALVRVPAFKKPSSARIELRSPDPATNPYLAFASILHVGLKGIEEGIEPPEPVEMDIYHMDEETRKKLRIDSLPSSLKEAVDMVLENRILEDVLGKSLFEKIIENKMLEWERFRIRVTDYEIETYYSML
jgi:glutamine synthetase